MQIKMQHKRTKFHTELNQVQLNCLVNIIVVQVKFEPRITESDIIISEKVDYDHPIECSSEQLQLLVIQ